mmetsp:Transcript_48394/g.85226  ORF Transcript_48394/g.85226 Transcript_48394/m.85226 type:complete len:214 (+) Transcript_48394:59-700(+)
MEFTFKTHSGVKPYSAPSPERDPSDPPRSPESPELPPPPAPPCSSLSVMPICLMALSSSFSIRAKRLSSSILSSSGQAISCDVDPPKRRIASIVVGLAAAGSLTWMPPARPTSPSLNSSLLCNLNSLVNFCHRTLGTEGMISTIISARSRRAKPIMSSFTELYAQLSCAIKRLRRKMMPATMKRKMAASTTGSSSKSSYFEALYICSTIRTKA